MLRRCVSLDTLKTKSASIMRDSKSDWSARLAHKPLGVDGGQFYAIGLQSSNSQGLEEEFHVFPIMKGPLQYSEEINGELPFFMPAHLLGLIFGHKEQEVFMSAYLYTPAAHKVAFTVGCIDFVRLMGRCWCEHSNSKSATSCKNLTAASWAQLFFAAAGGRRCFTTDRPMCCVGGRGGEGPYPRFFVCGCRAWTLTYTHRLRFIGNINC